MSPLDAALWALLGASTIEAFEMLAVIRTPEGIRWPLTRKELGPYLLAVVLRFGIAIGLGAAMSDQLDARFAAYVVGIAAPLIIARIFVNLSGPSGNIDNSPSGEVNP